MATSFHELAPPAARLFHEVIRSPDLKALWVMNETTGVFYDRGPNRLDTTAGVSSTGTAAAYGATIGGFRGVSFRGGDRVTHGGAGGAAASALAFDNADPFSVLAVIRPTAIAATGGILGQLIGITSPGWFWALNSSGQPFLHLNHTLGVHLISYSNTALVTTSGVIIGVTYDGASATGSIVHYRNGVNQGATSVTNTLTSTIFNGSTPPILGAIGGADKLNADLGFVAVWGRAVPAEEMRRFAYLGGFL